MICFLIIKFMRQFHLLIVIIRLMLSLYLCPNVITFSCLMQIGNQVQLDKIFSDHIKCVIKKVRFYKNVKYSFCAYLKVALNRTKLET